jgi:hypothetical protein
MSGQVVSCYVIGSALSSKIQNSKYIMKRNGERDLNRCKANYVVTQPGYVPVGLQSSGIVE